MTAPPARHPPHRRRRLAVAAGLLVAVGLTVSTAGSGPLADLAGDALYAALVWVVLAFARPVRHGGAARRTTGTTTCMAVAACTAVELLQLTGLPAAAGAAWWPLRYVLGTTFAAADLAAYAVGAALAGLTATLSARLTATLSARLPAEPPARDTAAPAAKPPRTPLR